MQPLSNAFIAREEFGSMERFYPLEAFVCGSCFLMQLDEFEPPSNIFSDYAYFSSFSDSWLVRAENFSNSMIDRLALTDGSLVVEIGSNDGYLLQYFAKRGIPALGIDPAANCAEAARARGVETLVAFFGKEVATMVQAAKVRANLIIANNVLAHVPDLNDVVAGIAALLASSGVATVEVPHLLALIEKTEYDTIYHEHYSYFSLNTARKVFAAQGLDIVDVEELPTHGGSIRLWAVHEGSTSVNPRVAKILRREDEAGLTSLATYRRFSQAVVDSKSAFWEFLIKTRVSGKTVAAYGAAAKGNTLQITAGSAGTL